LIVDGEKRELFLGFLPSPAKRDGVSAERGVDQVNLARRETIGPKALPFAIEDVPEPNASFVFLSEFFETARTIQRDPDEFLALRNDIVGGRFIGTEFAPVNLHTPLLAVANVASHVDVETSEIWGGIEQIDEILAAEDVGFRQRFVGTEFSERDGRNTFHLGLAKKFSPGGELLWRVRQRQAGGSLGIVSFEIDPKDIGTTG
jgi:hypothetical protein